MAAFKALVVLTALHIIPIVAAYFIGAEPITAFIKQHLYSVKSWLIAAVGGVIAYTAYTFVWLAMHDVPLSSVPLTEEEKKTGQDGKLANGNIRAPSGNIACFDPATMTELGEVVAMDGDQVRAIVSSARAAQAEWAKTSFSQRRNVLRRIMKFVLANADDICHVSMRDTGKTRVEAMLGEIMTTCEKVAWTCKYGEKVLAKEYRPTNMMTMHKNAAVEYHPLGVVAIIAPWNYPFHNLYGHIISGLFAGNAVVLKPSEFTSWSSGYFGRIIQTILKDAGHSPNLVQMVTGFSEAGAALVGSGVDKVVFTGSPGIGKHVMRGASATLTPVVLELGGKDPFIICDDADMDQVAQIALRGTYQNAGQNCVGIERMYVQSSIHDKFVEKMVSIVSQFQQGPPLLCPAADMGATVTPAQVTIIEDLVNDAVANGAKVRCGGKRNTALAPGLFFQPTILTDVTHDMKIVNEEVFGPVMSIIKFETDEDVIRMANATDYGLGSSVFTMNPARGEAIARRIRSGMTVTNDYAVNYLIQSLPFGGVKASGFDRFGGPEGLRGMCLQKSVVTDKISFIKTTIPPVLQYPSQPVISVSFIKGLVGMFYGLSLPSRAMSLLKLLGAVTAKPTREAALAAAGGAGAAGAAAGAGGSASRSASESKKSR